MYFCIPQALPSYLPTIFDRQLIWNRLQRKRERKEFPIHHIVWKQVQNIDLMNEISISRIRSLALILNLQILYFTQCIYGLSLLISSKIIPCSWSLASLPWSEINYLQGAITHDLKRFLSGPVNSFFIRRGPGPNKFTRKYLSIFLSSHIKLT